MMKQKKLIVEQRKRLITELPRIAGIGNFKGDFNANFLLVEILDGPKSEGGKPSNQVALKVYERLAEQKGVVVRFRGKELGCEGCLRVSVGREQEVDRFLAALEVVLKDIFQSKVEL